MSNDSLTSFLKKSGLIGTDKPQPTKQPTAKQTRKTTPKSSTPAAKKTTPTRTPRTSKPTPKRTHSSRPASSRSGNGRSSNVFRPRSMAGAKLFSNHNPDAGRPTVWKREKFHPTNNLKPGPKVGNIRVVPLGGMEQVGQNMMFLEWDNDIVVIDTGFLFPNPEHLGVDVLLPDISYLVKNKHKIRGVIYTHGHLDHIGGTPYIIPELGFPRMFATKLTKELILANTDHPEVTKKYNIAEINPQSKIKLGKFEFEFFHVNHSIPDGVGIVAKTPYGNIVHTSDFKIDHHPSDEQPADLGRIAEIGHQGVVLAMVDSTNALKPGHTISESIVERQLEKSIMRCPGRMIITTFASSIGRISKIVEAAEKCGRTVFISGRSMEKNIAIARKLNYLKCKDRTLKRMSLDADKMDPRKVLILSTGSQGEPLAALTRMSAGTHRDIKLNKHDTILFSSSPIIGNETAIVSVLNNLTEIGVTIIDKNQLDVYVSGHGYAEEVKMMTALLNPKYIAPIHGELYMRHGHRDLIVKDLDFNPRNAFIMKNGQGVVLTPKGPRLMTEKEAVPCAEVMVELGEKINDHILADRTMMADGGCIFVVIKQQSGNVKSIEIRARGFRHMNLNHEIFDLLKKELKSAFTKNFAPQRKMPALEKMLEKTGHNVIFQKFKKETMVEVVIV